MSNLPAAITTAVWCSQFYQSFGWMCGWLCQVQSDNHTDGFYNLIFIIHVRFLAPCTDGVDCTSRVVSHYARYDHAELARHRDLGLINQTTKDISPSQLSDIPSPRISPTVSTTQPPPPKFSSTRIFPSQAVAAAPDRFATPRAQYISPIKVIRRPSQSLSQKNRTFKCELCDISSYFR